MECFVGRESDRSGRRYRRQHLGFQTSRQSSPFETSQRHFPNRRRPQDLPRVRLFEARICSNGDDWRGEGDLENSRREDDGSRRVAGETAIWVDYRSSSCLFRNLRSRKAKLTFLSFLLRSALQPDAVEDILTRTQVELRKSVFGDDAEEAKNLPWSRAQAWKIVKDLSSKGEVSSLAGLVLLRRTARRLELTPPSLLFPFAAFLLVSPARIPLQGS